MASLICRAEQTLTRLDIPEELVKLERVVRGGASGRERGSQRVQCVGGDGRGRRGRRARSRSSHFQSQRLNARAARRLLVAMTAAKIT